MSQAKISLRLGAPEAIRISELLEGIFEEQGYAISAFEAELSSDKVPDWIVDLYVPADDIKSALQAIKDQIGSDGLGTKLVVTELDDDEDWIAMSLEGLKPVSAGRFFVHGSHDRDLIPAGSVSIEIEAGQAFGTGHHGTTAGCLEALHILLLQHDFEHILDMGTGTGLLAIGLAKALKQPIMASDIDPISVEVALENAKLNGVSNWLHVVAANGLHHSDIRDSGPFDLIVANILAGPLIELAGQVTQNLERGGALVLSGILDRQANKVTAAYVARGLRIARTSHRDGWVTLTFMSPL